jgi:3',5'-cyclic AMP phosphodiesterase CpdA
VRIVHLSDVHIQVDYRRLPLLRYGWRRALAQLEWRGLRRAQRFEHALPCFSRMVDEVRAIEPDHIVITGDLTALALEEEFESARAALGPLAADPSKLTVIPGNHDRYTAHSVCERRFERHFRELLRSDLPRFAGSTGFPLVRLLGDEVAVIGLDSTLLAPFPGLSFGRLGREQLGALSRLVEAPEVRDRALCVLVHHAPLARSGRPDSLTHGLWDSGPLLRLLAGRPCTLHHGHVHHRYWHRATAGRPDVFDAGSSTLRGREGYWVIELGRGGLESARERSPRR